MPIVAGHVGGSCVPCHVLVVQPRFVCRCVQCPSGSCHDVIQDSRRERVRVSVVVILVLDCVRQALEQSVVGGENYVYRKGLKGLRGPPHARETSGNVCRHCKIAFGPSGIPSGIPRGIWTRETVLSRIPGLAGKIGTNRLPVVICASKRSFIIYLHHPDEIQLVRRAWATPIESRNKA